MLVVDYHHERHQFFPVIYTVIKVSWSQKRVQNDSIHSIILDVHVFQGVASKIPSFAEPCKPINYSLKRQHSNKQLNSCNVLLLFHSWKTSQVDYQILGNKGRSLTQNNQSSTRSLNLPWHEWGYLQMEDFLGLNWCLNFKQFWVRPKWSSILDLIIFKRFCFLFTIKHFKFSPTKKKKKKKKHFKFWIFFRYSQTVIKDFASMWCLWQAVCLCYHNEASPCHTHRRKTILM